MEAAEVIPVIRVKSHFAYRNDPIADLNFTIAMRDSAFGEPRDEDAVGSVYERRVSLAAGDAEAQSLPDLVADERRVQRDFVNDIRAALK